ncbi:MAG TPA: hypothetical protein ENI79_00940 [Rhodospirillales bacterium]|nr:hypothetical protein [Rhodospirillales bacterium]
MNAKSAGLKSNLQKIDAPVLSKKGEPTKKELDEIPELPREFFDEGQLYRDGEPVERRGRGAQKKPTKRLLSLRLSPEVIEYFQATGKGWQTRINDVLRKYVKTH